MYQRQRWFGSHLQEPPPEQAEEKSPPEPRGITALKGPGARAGGGRLTRIVLLVASVLAVGLASYALFLALQPVPDSTTAFKATSESLLAATLNPYVPSTSTPTPGPEVPVSAPLPNPTSTSTPEATATRRPRRTTASPTSTPAATPTPFPAPALLEPTDGETMLERATFRWQWDGPPLPANYAFDLRIWSWLEEEKDSPKRGVIPPTRDLQAEVAPRYTPAFLDYGPGDYYWTVVVVELSPDAPPKVVGKWGEKRRIGIP